MWNSSLYITKNFVVWESKLFPKGLGRNCLLDTPEGNAAPITCSLSWIFVYITVI